MDRSINFVAIELIIPSRHENGKITEGLTSFGKPEKLSQPRQRQFFFFIALTNLFGIHRTQNHYTMLKQKKKRFRKILKKLINAYKNSIWIIVVIIDPKLIIILVQSAIF